MRKISFAIAIFFFFSVVLFIPKPPVHANPVALAPVFAGAVGDISLATAPETLGLSLLIAAGCYGVYKLSQPQTQQALKNWASGEVEAFQSGKTDWKVYVDSSGNYFMDNLDSFKRDFNNNFNPSPDEQSARKMIPSFPSMPAVSSGSYHNEFQKIMLNNLGHDVCITFGCLLYGNVQETTLNLKQQHTIGNNVYVNSDGKVVDSNFSDMYQGVQSKPDFVSGVVTGDYDARDGYQLPFIESIIDLDDNSSYNVYPNVDNPVFPFPLEFPDSSNSIKITPSTDPKTVTKDSNLTKVNPISQDQTKPVTKTGDDLNPNNPDSPSNPDLPGDNDIPKIDWSPLKLSFQDKFPFCIPFDLINFIKSFQGERKAPSWHVQFPAVSFGGNSYFGNCSFDLDLGKFDKIAIILRYFLLIGFVVELIKKTRDLIRG